MITWSQWGLQDALSPVIEEFIFFHDFTLIIISYITISVLWILTSTIFNRFVCLNLLEAQIIECIWTLIPAAALTQIAIPSLMLLYILDESFMSQITIKTIGHQWFWSYEYTDSTQMDNPVLFDSYIMPSKDLSIENFRLLETDNRAIAPFQCAIRLLVRSADVLHSWALPSLGIKVDAAPGRLNQLNFMSHRPGIFFGQCSEICGANHRFMPIVIEFVSPKDYLHCLMSYDE